MIGFDLSNKCCFKCVYCSFQNKLNKDRENDFLNLDLFKKIINEQIENKIKYRVIFLAVGGESLMHPYFNEIISFLFKNNEGERLFDIISLNTNVAFLSPESTDTIHNLILNYPGKFMITLSINAYSSRAFKLVKGQDLLKITNENTKYLLRDKKNKNVTDEIVLLQYLVHELSKEESKKFLDFWESFLQDEGINYIVEYELPFKKESDVAIIFKRVYWDNQEKYDKMHQDVVKELGLLPLEEKKKDLEKFSPRFHSVKREPCASLWLSPIVRVDGILSPCLQDDRDLQMLGNLKNDSFFDLWFSESAHNLRKKHIAGDFENISICKDCDFFIGPKISKEDISGYLRIFDEINGEDDE